MDKLDKVEMLGAGLVLLGVGVLIGSRLRVGILTAGVIPTSVEADPQPAEAYNVSAYANDDTSPLHAMQAGPKKATLVAFVGEAPAGDAKQAWEKVLEQQVQLRKDPLTGILTYSGTISIPGTAGKLVLIALLGTERGGKEVGSDNAVLVRGKA